MNLQNGYKVLYEKITVDAETGKRKRIFYASKNNACDPSVDDKIVEAVIGKYKLIYEKDGRFFGSEENWPTANDFEFRDFEKVFKVAEDAGAADSPEDDEPAAEPEAPVAEEPETPDDEVPEDEEPVVAGDEDEV